MAGLVAYFFAPPPPDGFTSAMVRYLQAIESDKMERIVDKSKKLAEFMQWLSEVDVSDYVTDDVKVDGFIAQCAMPTAELGAIDKQVCGTVTSITEEGGLVDGHIFFDLNEVTGFGNDDVVKLGDRLDVHAISSKSSGGGWRALTATKLSTCDWTATEESVADDSEPLCTEEGLTITWISNVSEHSYTLDHGSKCFPRRQVEDFVYAVGDRVKASITPQGSVSSVTPLQVKEMTGKVTYAPRVNSPQACDGTISGDVKFSNHVCEDGYVPRKGDDVKLVAVENKDSRRPWRAISITLLIREKRGAKLPALKSGDWIMRGDYPVYERKRPSLPSFLPKYTVPDRVRDCVNKGMDVLRLLPALKENLNLSTHAARFKALLYLEEVSVDLEMRKHYLAHASLERRGEYLGLHVPGLSDGKPNVSVGDVVILREASGRSFSSTEHHGFIHHILLEKEELLIKFHATLQDNFEESDVFNVAFTHSRATFRRCHFAVEMAQRGFCSKLLFPEEMDTRNISAETTHIKTQKIEENQTSHFFSSVLNERQRQAVNQIMKGGGRKLPYILFGPPGTGKTVTLVEVITQIYHSNHSSRILVCAPSNSAVDVICERLAQTCNIEPSDMSRFNAFKRLEETIPESILEFCRNHEPVEQTANYRIILSTCANAGILYDLGTPRGHISHICIDEAGQATEPEVLIPLGLLDRGQVIMAGDPKQLGPVIMSPLAKLYGLDISLLERLMTFKIYSRNDEMYEEGYNPAFVTKLVNNYRSHGKLIKLPSEMFYRGELRPCCELSSCGQFLDWPRLPATGFPIIFHGVVGQQLRESDCPSLMNPAEIVQTIRYVKLLHAERDVDLTEIGIITPYRKQVEKMRIMLRAVGIIGVKVGSVEEFQGQERSVILISTVRSIVANIPEDADAKSSMRLVLGFVSSPKRFNVATTRAKSLMIVLGNPFVLSLDQHWKALLQYCVSNLGYTGCDIRSIHF